MERKRNWGESEIKYEEWGKAIMILGYKKKILANNDDNNNEYDKENWLVKKSEMMEQKKAEIWYRYNKSEEGRTKN